MCITSLFYIHNLYSLLCFPKHFFSFFLVQQKFAKTLKKKLKKLANLFNIQLCCLPQSYNFHIICLWKNPLVWGAAFLGSSTLMSLLSWQVLKTQVGIFAIMNKDSLSWFWTNTWNPSCQSRICVFREREEQIPQFFSVDDNFPHHNFWEPRKKEVNIMRSV